MTTLRRFKCEDLYTFNSINLDPLTETYNFAFYLEYLARWPELCQMAVGPAQAQMGYMLGKVEGQDKQWHGHVTAVTVNSDCRRLGLATKLMHILEEATHKVHNGWFIDLFVRQSNKLAIGMYEKLGYAVYRRVLGYYTGANKEDALDMHKAMPRDKDKQSMVPLKKPVRPEDLDFD